MSHTACLRSSLSAVRETVHFVTAIFGCARVSTLGQDLDVQLTALSAAGVAADRVFTDQLSGSAKTDRPDLAAMLDYARAGDTVVVAAIMATLAELELELGRERRAASRESRRTPQMPPTKLHKLNADRQE